VTSTVPVKTLTPLEEYSLLIFLSSSSSISEMAREAPLSDKISKDIRNFREDNKDYPIHMYKNFDPNVYISILAKAACAVGNSSSFVRDASFIGVPVVLVGTRQDGRELGDSVIRVEPEKNDILLAIQKQLSNGRYKCSDLYGKPGVSKKIVETILSFKPYSQKKLYFAITEGK